MGILDIARERIRQAKTGDDKYFKRLLYFFELRVPEGATTDAIPGPYLYPLVLPPTAIQLSEPFVVEQTPTLDGGLYVEEHGIIARELTVSATTGFRPRRNKGQSNFDVLLPTEKKSYSRSISRAAIAVTDALSGQRHFQFLQDSVFRAYADLKRDPNTSKGTELFFHNLKDDEHWRVVPLNFSLDRKGSSAVTYPHQFKLLLVGPASEVGDPSSESKDKTVLDKVSNAYAMTKFGLSLVQGAILDLAGVQNQLTNLMRNGGALISEAGEIAGATNSFLEGTERFIRVPENTIQRTVDAFSSGLAAIEQAKELGTLARTGALAPAALLNAIEKLNDGLLIIGSYPEQFQTDIEAIVQRFNQLQSLAQSKSPEALANAEAIGPPQTIRAFAELGTALLPGDRRRARDDIGLGSFIPRYTSATERLVEAGDTLVNLAARFLGDARLWQIIAVFNALQPPYISEQGLPGTVKVGDRILIPNFGKTQRRAATATTVGVAIEAPAEEHYLGTDLAIEEDEDGQFDFVVDTENGATDLTLRRGVANLSQALLTRLFTERGTDVLYRNLGLRRTIGIGLTELDIEQAQFAVIEAIKADPRIADVNSIDFRSSQDDAMVADVTATVRGLNRDVKVRTPLGS